MKLLATAGMGVALFLFTDGEKAFADGTGVKIEMKRFEGQATISCPAGLACDDLNNDYDWRAYEFDESRIRLWMGFGPEVIGRYDSFTFNGHFRRLFLRFYHPERETAHSRFYSRIEIENVEGREPVEFFSVSQERVLAFRLKGFFASIEEEPKEGECADGDVAGKACSRIEVHQPFDLSFRLLLP